MRMPEKPKSETENNSTGNNNLGGKTIAMIIGAMVVGGLIVALFFMTGNEEKTENPPVAVVEQTEQKETSSAPAPSPQKPDTNEPKH